MNIGSIFGAGVVGTMFNLILYGASFLQCVIYFSRYKRDRVQIKTFVVLLLVIDTVQTCLLSVALYEYIVVHFGELEYLSRVNVALISHPHLAGITACCVQIFFAIRIKLVTGYKWAYWLVITFALISCGGAIATGVFASRYRPFAEWGHLKWPAGVWVVAAVVANVIAAAVLVSYLQRHRTGYKGTDGVIDRIVRITLQTGLATCILAIADLTVFLIMPLSDLHLLFDLALPKLYTNSVMSILISRNSIPSDIESQQETSGKTFTKTTNVSHSRSTQPSTSVIVFAKQTTITETFDDSAFGKQDTYVERDENHIPMSPIRAGI